MKFLNYAGLVLFCVGLAGGFHTLESLTNWSGINDLSKDQVVCWIGFIMFWAKIR